MRYMPEADWKVLRRVHKVALARFCEQLLAEVASLARDDARSPHERYLHLYKLVQDRDRQMARLFNNPRRSGALHMLAQLREEGLLTHDDLASLTPETRDAILLVLERRHS
jgi:hypothetical protein